MAMIGSSVGVVVTTFVGVGMSGHDFEYIKVAEWCS